MVISHCILVVVIQGNILWRCSLVIWHFSDSSRFVSRALNESGWIFFVRCWQVREKVHCFIQKNHFWHPWCLIIMPYSWQHTFIHRLYFWKNKKFWSVKSYHIVVIALKIHNVIGSSVARKNQITVAVNTYKYLVFPWPRWECVM